MIINENNIDESVRVMKLLKDGILEGNEGDEELKYVISPREELSAVTEIFVCLEMNDRYYKNEENSNKPSEKQLAFALNLIKKDPIGAKIILETFGKSEVDKLTRDEISQFISKLSGRP